MVSEPGPSATRCQSLATVGHLAPASHPAPAAVLAGFGRAQPAVVVRQDEVWEKRFSSHFGGSSSAQRVFANAGVTTRRGVLDPLAVDVSGWSTERRMRRFATAAPPLGRAATEQALAAAGLEPSDVGLFAVASCTGYSTPGLDILLADELGMPPDVQRLFIGHMGCYAALPGLGAVSDFATARGRAAVLLCVELPTLHVQPPSRELQQVVAHALFADGAAAVAVRPAVEVTSLGQAGLTLLDIVAHTDRSTAHQMTWDVTDHGFRMGLSPRVSETLARHVADVVGKLLARHGLTPPEVAGWAVHPGGPRIIDVVESELDLPAGALEVSRATLRDHGNCSSATVLMVLQELVGQRPVAADEHVVTLAFGPGLTLYAALLRG